MAGSHTSNKAAGQLRKYRMLTLFAALLVGVFAGCGRSKDEVVPETVTVLAAASTADAIGHVARIFEDNTQIKVRISTGPSGGLAQQITAGAPADVFLSANNKWANAIVEAGLASETVELFTNRLVLVVPQGNPAGITDPKDLTSAKVSRVAIAGENVPAGIYAEQALRNLQLFDQLQQSRKLARGSDVRITLTYVEQAEADAGIVYATDARISTHVEVITALDPQSYDTVVYRAVLLKSAADKTPPVSFFDFLQSSAAQTAFGQYGFTPSPPSPETESRGC